MIERTSHPLSGRTCDTHVHVFDPARFPFADRRRFTPGYAGVDRLIEHLQRMGAGRFVLVQPSVYGSDHGCMADALQRLGGRGRGVAVLAPDCTPREIAGLDSLGVRATRINFVVDGNADAAAARIAVAQAVKQVPSHWHVQLHISMGVLLELDALIRNSACHFVIDHIGFPPPGAEEGDDWRRLCDLAASKRLFVKLSAPYLAASRFSALEPLVLGLLRAAPRSVLWGTNWPHTQGTARVASAESGRVEPFRVVDDIEWLEQCRRWLATAGLPADTFDTAAQALYEF